MTVKQRFESHPVVWIGALMLAAFGTGFAAREHLSGAAPDKGVICNLEGVEELTKGHNRRMETLQQSLAQFESLASDESKISFYQDQYRASADRVRSDMVKEIATYNSSASTLQRKCVSGK